MRHAFVLGIGRSGTTLLGRLTALSPTPMRFISEAFTCLSDTISPDKSDTSYVSPSDQERIRKVQNTLPNMECGFEIFKPKMRDRIERDDSDAECMLVKEVHALLAFPQILANSDCRVVVITRETSRVLDSYLQVKGNYIYLVDEHRFLAAYVSGRIAEREPIIDAALERVSPSVVRYLKRPKWMTSRLRRIVCTMEVMRHFLLAWAEQDERVMAVQYEELCKEPVAVMRQVFVHLGLKCDEQTERQTLKMTSGESTEYYATDKDSSKILNQAFRKLKQADLKWIGDLISDHR